MIEAVDKCKALGDSNRFRIVMMLREKELCVCELLSVLDISGGTLSNHLKILRNAGIIKLEKQGKWAIYSIADKVAGDLAAFMKTLSDGDELIHSDLKQLESIDRLTCSSK